MEQLIPPQVEESDGSHILEELMRALSEFDLEATIYIVEVDSGKSPMEEEMEDYGEDTSMFGGMGGGIQDAILMDNPGQ